MIFLSLIEFELIALGIIYPIIALFMQRKLSDIDKMYDLQETMNEKQKKSMEMQKALQQKRKEHLELSKKEGVATYELQRLEDDIKQAEIIVKQEFDKMQKETMNMMPEMMRYQLKALVVLTLLSIVVYFWFIPYAFAGPAGKATFTMFNFSYKSLFFWTAFITGLLVTLVVRQYDMRRRKKMKAQKAAQQ